MAKIGCGCRTNCTGFGIIAGIIIGIITALLTVTGNIVITPAFLWVLFGIAVGYLAVTLIASALTQSPVIRECICSTLPVLFTGILGTILTSVVLITIDIATASVLGAVIIGLLALFFTLTVTTTACLAKCLSGCGD